MWGGKDNGVMKVLTILARIFIPMSFVTGLDGMNFDSEASELNMPELQWALAYSFCARADVRDSCMFDRVLVSKGLVDQRRSLKFTNGPIEAELTAFVRICEASGFGSLDRTS